MISISYNDLSKLRINDIADSEAPITTTFYFSLLSALDLRLVDFLDDLFVEWLLLFLDLSFTGVFWIKS